MLKVPLDTSIVDFLDSLHKKQKISNCQNVSASNENSSVICVAVGSVRVKQQNKASSKTFSCPFSLFWFPEIQCYAGLCTTVLEDSPNEIVSG